MTLAQKTKISADFITGLELLDMKPLENSNLIFVSEIYNTKTKITPDEWFSLEKADELKATAIYFRKFNGRPSKPQIYVYDFTNNDFTEEQLRDYLAIIQKKIWSSGLVPFVYIFKKTEVKILDCTKPVTINEKLIIPTYLEESLSLIQELSNSLKKYSARKFDDGIIWEQEYDNIKYDFKSSAYQTLLIHLKDIYEKFIRESNIEETIAQKLIVQCILVKYIEERVGEDDNCKVQMKEFYSELSPDNNVNNLCDVLRTKGLILKLFDKLNKYKFNGKIFDWTDFKERKLIENKSLSKLANFLDADHELSGQGNFWKLYSFNYIPVELISRLYEEFLSKTEEGKTKKGIVYTPAHLATFLVDECMPLAINKIPKYLNYKILDPACGSGIFLVIAYKRLVQWWRIKNKYKKITNIKVLKKLLKQSIYGVDVEDKAVQLTTFSLSLAICDLLTPKQIWQELQFDDLKEENIINENFFNWVQINKKLKFDLIIGNPPFKREKDSYSWESKDGHTSISLDGQIALRFLLDSILCLKPKKLLCLIMPATALLHSSKTLEFRKEFFRQFNVVQILDFISLARNQSLWDNKEPPTAAVFVKRCIPDANNILHLTLRRTQPVKHRILFEVDEYDYHYVSREEAVNNPFIWKINLLGGGRLKSLINKYSDMPTLEMFLRKNQIDWGDGIRGPESLPVTAFKDKGIDTSMLDSSYLSSFKAYESKLSRKKIFRAPHILINKNTGEEVKGEKRLLISLEEKDFPFNNETIGIYSKEYNILSDIFNKFKENMTFYRFYIYCTSGRALVYRNTSIAVEDILRLPYLEGKFQFSTIEQNIMNDVLEYMQNFMRKGENSLILDKINLECKEEILQYGCSFADTLNLIYEKESTKFVLKNVLFSSTYIATTFCYTSDNIDTEVRTVYENEDIKNIFDAEIHKSLLAKRVIRIYKTNELIIIKPNQIRYWLKSIAYRDADKTFIDLVNQGY